MMFEGEARFVCTPLDGLRESPYTIRYEADSYAEAITLFLKWIDCRMVEVPEVFDMLGTISVREFVLDEIGINGQLRTRRKSHFFLWKEGNVYHDQFRIAPHDWKPSRACPDPLGISNT